MPRRFRRTCPVCGRPDLKNISTHLLRVQAYLPKRENLIVSKPECHHGIRTLTDRMATTLGEEKKRNNLNKREEKMINSPVNTRQKRRKSNWTNFIQIQFIYLISLGKKLNRSLTEALQQLERSSTKALQTLNTVFLLYRNTLQIKYSN